MGGGRKAKTAKMEAKAYAKINLTLEVLGRREDGYHEVSTILQTIDLADNISFEEATGLSVESSDPSLAGGDNLVRRAAELLRRTTGHSGGAHIRLEKRIPMNMGLGGGSSDAAATLLCLNTLWNRGLDYPALHKLAASLGSDVPFFLTGGTCLATGRGEEVTPLAALPCRWVVLVCPPEEAPVSTIGKTARMYSLLDQGDFSDGSPTRRMLDALENGRPVDGLLFNGFQPAGRRASPQHSRLVELLGEAGGQNICVAGSGSALYCLFDLEDEARRVNNSLKEGGLLAYCVRTVQPSPWPDQDLQGRGGAKS